MERYRRISALLLSFFLLLGGLPFGAMAVSDAVAEPSVSAESAVLIEVSSGDLVFAKNCDLRLPMASTTKIMTALTALSIASPTDLIVTDTAAVGVEGSSIYLCAGETLTLEQMLYAVMLESANDAATAIAIALCGSEAAFADEMNRIAADIGLTDTHFVNPHGLDDEAHYTTARELAKITQRAMQNELFRTIVSTRKSTIPHPDDEAERLLINHNKLLRIYEDCIGVKTGFTKRSGRCLVSAAERDGVELIAVTLNAPNDWDDHIAMLDYGFSRYRSILLCEVGAIPYNLPIVGGTEDSDTQTVTISSRDSLRVTLPITASEVSYVVEAPRFAYAPVVSGETLGRVLFLCDKDGDGVRELIAESPMIACSSAKAPQKRGFWAWLCALFGR